jgi:hypothetical protein
MSRRSSVLLCALLVFLPLANTAAQACSLNGKHISFTLSGCDRVSGNCGTVGSFLVVLGNKVLLHVTPGSGFLLTFGDKERPLFDNEKPPKWRDRRAGYHIPMDVWYSTVSWDSSRLVVAISSQSAWGGGNFERNWYNLALEINGCADCRVLGGSARSVIKPVNDWEKVLLDSKLQSGTCSITEASAR